MATTRFPPGVTNATPESTLGQMGQLDPTKFHSFWDDFDKYVAADWIVTNVGAGTEVLTAGQGGTLLLTNTAAAPDSTFLQNAIASFLLVPGKRTFFKFRAQVSDAVQSVFQAGLVLTDATPLDATDGIYFLKADGAATVDVFVRKDATTGSVTQAAVATLVAATNFTCGFEYDGKSKVKFFFNDAQVATLAATSVNLPDIILNPSFGIGNGEAIAKSMTVDYVFVAQER